MPTERVSGKVQYDYHRGAVESTLAQPERFQRLSVTDLAGQMQIIQGWKYRYLIRFATVESNSIYPTCVADSPAADILTARHREQDAHFPQAPDWSEDLLFFLDFILTTQGVTQEWNGQPPLLRTIHEYGPSLRQLWGKAKANGADDAAAWGAIRDWILYRPPSWECDDLRKKSGAPEYDGKLAQRMDTIVAWTSSGDLNFPWFAKVPYEKGEEHWRIRINDFPDEYMYSLLAGEEVIGDFHDWPIAWTRTEGPGWVDPNAAVKMGVFAAPKNIAPELLLDRYMHGEHEEVWNDLIRLGSEARKKPYFEPAEAVCRETVRRSRQNLILLIGRLYELEFEFWNLTKPRMLCPLTQDEAKEPWKQPAVWELPKKDAAAELARLEKKGIVIPLAARIWAEEIGQVSFIGSHPRLCPFYMESQPDKPVYADPLMVSPILPLLSRSLDELGGNTEPVLISYDDVLKAEIAMDPGSDKEYSLEYPNAVADAKMDGLWYDATFVGYLRKNFEWGGFPGWARYSERPEKEIAFLREGLIPI